MAAQDYVQVTNAFVWTSGDTADAFQTYVRARVSNPTAYTVTVNADGSATVMFMSPGGQMSGWRVGVGDAWTPSGVLTADTLAASYGTYPGA